MTTEIFYTLWTLTQAFEKQQHSFSWLEAESTAAIFTTFLTHTRTLFTKSQFLWLAEMLVRLAVCFLALDIRTKQNVNTLLPSGRPAGWGPDSMGRIMILWCYDKHYIRAKLSPRTSCLSLYEITNTNSQQTVCLGTAGHRTSAAKDSILFKQLKPLYRYITFPEAKSGSVMHI